MAVAVLKDALSRGADNAVLLSDKKFSGADTLATSHVLAWAIKKNGSFDLIFCGRQAIDGDTAQVGPQVAEKLNIPQATLAESIDYLYGDEIVIRKVIDGGYEQIRGKVPLLITVTNTAAKPRPFSAKRLMFWKKARLDVGIDNEEERQALENKGLLIPVWNFDKLECPAEICGFVGSPTRIKQVESVKLTPPDNRYFDTSEEGVKDLINELIDEHII
jgi:electron transfer flavoprotein beta subunit